MLICSVTFHIGLIVLFARNGQFTMKNVIARGFFTTCALVLCNATCRYVVIIQNDVHVILGAIESQWILKGQHLSYVD